MILHILTYLKKQKKAGGKPTEEILAQTIPFEFRWLVPHGRSHQIEYQTLEVPCVPNFPFIPLGS